MTGYGSVWPSAQGFPDTKPAQSVNPTVIEARDRFGLHHAKTARDAAIRLQALLLP
jgi:hypothetical protein